MTDGAERRSRAFALVELLVVIAIIAILIAILLSVILKVRRKGMILTSPIVYETQLDNSLHVTDPGLNWDLAIFSEPKPPSVRQPRRTMWSPSGQKIGFDLGGGPDTQYICVVNPMTGEIIKHPQIKSNYWPRTYFRGWKDDSRFIEEVSNTIVVRDADTGAIVDTLECQATGGVIAGPFYPMPPGSPAPYIAVWNGAVRLVTQGFREGKAIWLPKTLISFPRACEDYHVEVDPTGEWVAWTMSFTQGSSSYKTAIKRLGDPTPIEPTYVVVGGTGSGSFVAWTDSGNMLFAVGDSGLLVITNKSGNVLRSVAPPAGVTSGEGSWRRWGHR